MPPYKTITMELLQERTHPVTLAMLDHYSAHLRDLHLEAIQSLSRQGIPTQIESEAMEMAIQDMKTRLEIEFPSQPGPFNLDDAIRYVRKFTPPAT